MVIIKQPLVTIVSLAIAEIWYTGNIVLTPVLGPYTHAHFLPQTRHKPHTNNGMLELQTVWQQAEAKAEWVPFLEHDKRYGNSSCCQTNIHSHTNFPTSLISESLSSPQSYLLATFKSTQLPSPSTLEGVQDFSSIVSSALYHELTACYSILSVSFLFPIQPVIKLSKRCISSEHKRQEIPWSCVWARRPTRKSMDDTSVCWWLWEPQAVLAVGPPHPSPKEESEASPSRHSPPLAAQFQSKERGISVSCLR